MRGHQSGYRKLSKGKDQREALLRGLARDLILRERITTTVPRAKEAKKFTEELITLGKHALAATAPEQKLHYRRQALAALPDQDVVKRIFDEVAPRVASRPGGYTRIVHLGTRKGDAAEVALLELVEQAPRKVRVPRGRKEEAEEETTER